MPSSSPSGDNKWIALVKHRQAAQSDRKTLRELLTAARTLDPATLYGKKMPSFFTAEIPKGQSFIDFVLRVALDDDDTRNPYKLNPFFIEQLKAAEERLELVTSWSEEELAAHVRQYNEELLQAYKNFLKLVAEDREAFFAMRDKVVDWQPPATKEHEEFKGFLLSQIYLSTPAATTEYSEPSPASAQDVLERAQRAVQEAQDELDKARARIKERTEFLIGLYQSLGLGKDERKLVVGAKFRYVSLRSATYTIEHISEDGLVVTCRGGELNAAHKTSAEELLSGATCGWELPK